MTIKNRDIILAMLRNDGVHPGDPQVSSIWRYTDPDKRTLYAIFPSVQHDIYTSPRVKDPVLLWTRSNGLTGSGEEELKGDKEGQDSGTQE